jgi:hypothetical protein
LFAIPGDDPEAGPGRGGRERGFVVGEVPDEGVADFPAEDGQAPAGVRPGESVQGRVAQLDAAQLASGGGVPDRQAGFGPRGQPPAVGGEDEVPDVAAGPAAHRAQPGDRPRGKGVGRGAFLRRRDRGVAHAE